MHLRRFVSCVPLFEVSRYVVIQCKVCSCWIMYLVFLSSFVYSPLPISDFCHLFYSVNRVLQLISLCQSSVAIFVCYYNTSVKCFLYHIIQIAVHGLIRNSQNNANLIFCFKISLTNIIPVLFVSTPNILFSFAYVFHTFVHAVCQSSIAYLNITISILYILFKLYLIFLCSFALILKLQDFVILFQFANLMLLLIYCMLSLQYFSFML